MSNSPLLEIKNLNISYVSSNGNERVIVNDGNLSINPGEIVLIIGENGSGKSSIFKSIVGDLNDDLLVKIKTSIRNLFKRNKAKFRNKKELYFNGKHIVSDSDLNLFRQSIGYSSQEDDVDKFYERKVWNYVLDYMSSAYGYSSYSTSELEERAQFVYDELECNKYCEGRLKKMKLKKCSGGEKKITSLLAALCRRDARLIILDEPLNNLDAFHARKLNNYLVELKRKPNPPGILIITHCPMFLDVDKVYELKKGKLTLLENGKYVPKNCYGICDLNLKKYLEEE
jgi:ABC-type multidrug transport system ATPase subunit